jgi:hypothetical protein
VLLCGHVHVLGLFGVQDVTSPMLGGGQRRRRIRGSSGATACSLHSCSQCHGVLLYGTGCWALCMHECSISVSMVCVAGMCLAGLHEPGGGQRRRCILGSTGAAACSLHLLLPACCVSMCTCIRYQCQGVTAQVCRDPIQSDADVYMAAQVRRATDYVCIAQTAGHPEPGGGQRRSAPTWQLGCGAQVICMHSAQCWAARAWW